MNRRIRLMMGGIAALGVVTAHGLAYFFAEPDPHQRLGLLQHTGHRWWTAVMAVGIGLGVTCFGALIDRWRRSDPGASFDRNRMARWLIAFQAGAFLGLESFERLLSGGDIWSVATETPVVIGLVLQIVLALLEVWLLSLVAAGVRYLVTRARHPEPCPRAVSFPFLQGLPVPRPLVAEGGLSLRGPPNS